MDVPMASSSHPMTITGLKDCGDQPSSNVVSLSYTSLPDIEDPEIQPILRRECAEIGKVPLRFCDIIGSSPSS